MTMTSTLTAQFSKPPTSTTQLYRIDAAERRLGVSRSTIYRLVNEVQLELVKIGKRSSRITAVSLDALIERCREGYRKIVDYQLIPRLGQIKLADIKRRDLRDWMDEMDASNKGLANIQSVLRKALTDAVEDELLDDNPLTRYTYRKTQPPLKRDTVDPFTPAEQRAIIEKCPPPMANQVQFALWSGLRTSELVALTWHDIDFRRGVIIVDKALTQAAKGTIEDTKTRAGRREVKMLGPARAALQAQKTHTYLTGGPVFAHPIKGTQWSGDQEIRKYWVRLLRQAQVRYRRPYQTRHTYASMMLSAGEHPMWVARQMGHSNWAMIIRVYGKWMPSADDQAGSRAEEKFSAAQ